MAPVHLNSRGDRCSNIWVVAAPDARVNLISSSDQYVAVDLIHEDSTSRLVFIHGSNSYTLRRNLWIDLLNLLTDRTILMGDFNALRGAHERIGGTPPPDIACREFNAFIDTSTLMEPSRSGLFTTWSGRRHLPDHVESVLDRILVSDGFSDLWFAVTWATLPRTVSDHSPIVLVCSHGNPGRPKPFRFLDMWKLHPGFDALVKNSWQEHIYATCPITRVMAKLKRLKHVLRTWNREVFGHVSAEIANLQDLLSDTQATITVSGYTDSLFDREVDLQAQLHVVLDRQSTMAQQQSRIHWLRDGDRNTRFFHNVVKRNRASHHITHLFIDGEACYDQDRITSHIIHHFRSLFSEGDDEEPDYSTIESLIPHSVTAAQGASLTAIPSALEVKAAVFEMDSTSAPGPDGYGGSFFHSCWSIVADDVTAAVIRFFTHNYIPKGLNSSTIILIPKKNSATVITDFRPIVLSNFLFKIISKIIASRLAEVANIIVSQHQFGFIKGRSIHDCIVLGSEGVNCMDFSDKGMNMACKIDISKAFDTMRWSFMLKVLEAFGFPIMFIHWISLILESARLSILHNGQLHGYFACSRGVRQGDPMSPILFGIAEDILSRIFFRQVIWGHFKPMKYTRYIPFPSHLFYADDILIFGKATVDNANSCKRVLDDYGRLSGQICSPSKSHVYFGKGVEAALKGRISEALGFQLGSTPFDYLGVPLFAGHPRACHLLAIKDKVLSHFSKWNGSQLSIAGRLCLIRSVVQSSTIHSMLVYRWPSTFLHEIDKACRNFLWGGDPLVKPSCSVTWNKVCSSKEEGGLGVRSFAIINESLLSKLAWKIMVDKGFGFEMMRAKYLNHGLRQKYIQHTSSIWTSARRSFARISEEVHCSIGDGSTVLFWLDDWLGYRLCDKLHIPEFMHKFLTQRVSSYFYDGIWHFTQNFVDLYPAIVVDILMLPLGDGVDVRFWKPALHGQVTSKLMFSHLSRRHIKVKWGSWIWDSFVPVRRSITCWRILHRRLPTLDLLRRRGFTGPNFCILCAQSEESIDHIFWDCPLAAVVWYAFRSWFGLQDYEFPDFNSFLVYAMDKSFSTQIARLWKLGILTIVWYIWDSRNRCTWDGILPNSYHILKMVKVAFSEASSSAKLGQCSRSWSDYVILRNLGVKGSVSSPPDPISVSWWPPLGDWIKANTDGSASGAPGRIGAGGVFRDSFGVVRGCFHIDGGDGFAFEAELLAAISAIEFAFLRGWRRLWLETDSMYVASILETRSLKVPWRFFRSWKLSLRRLEDMEFRVSHIYREGNSVADIMASSSTPEGWWPFAIDCIRQAVSLDASVPRFHRRS